MEIVGIATKSSEEIRKAFFSKKVDKLIDDMLSEGQLTTQQIVDLHAYLDSLEGERQLHRKAIDKHQYGTLDEIRVHKLVNMSLEEKKELKDWLDSKKKIMNEIIAIMNGVHVAITDDKKIITQDDWFEIAAKIVSLMQAVDEYEIQNERLYNAKLIGMIDDLHCSRAEAENRAKLTEYYKEFKRAKRLKENILIFEMMCKKKYSNN